MKYQGVTLLLVIIFARYSAATVTPIANGGTNWGGPATNAKIIYTSAGSMIENAGLRSIGTNLDIVNPSSTITHLAPSMLNLQGVVNNQPNGPHLQTYVNDSYPVMQIFSWSHDLNGIAFDSYLDSAANWISSDHGSNFRTIKFNDKFMIDYSAGNSQGGGIDWLNAVSIANNSTITASSSVITNLTADSVNIETATINTLLLGSGGANLDYYGIYSTNFTCYGITDVDMYINAARVGKQVVITFKGVNQTFSNITVLCIITGHLPEDYRPKSPSATPYTRSWPVMINDGVIKTGSIEFYTDLSSNRFTIYGENGAPFSAGAYRGWGDISISFYKM